MAAVAACVVLLAACQDATTSGIPKQFKPVPSDLSEKMRQMNMSETGPIFIRIFKESSELEVWKQQRGGKYALLKTYEICKWSGVLGPKIAEGDRQAPEGFYTVTPAQMNPKSSYYLSFNIGYPNAFDRSLGRTGSHLMVHGACSSAGCYSMTDESAGELFALARDSFRGGQRAFQIQAFPFRMTPENMAKHRDNEHYEFWEMLKVGSDHFELTRVPPKVDVCDRRYVFNVDAGGRSISASSACPPLTVAEEIKTAVDAKQLADASKIAEEAARLQTEAEQAAEQKRIAEEKRIAAEKRAAEKEAALEARNDALQKRLGVFGRLLNRGKDEPDASAVAAGEAQDTPVTAFAPANTPVPPKKPAASAATGAETTASIPPKAPSPQPPAQPQQAAAPQPKEAASAPVAETPTRPTITPDMTPEIPPAGEFVKKPFLWPGEEDTADNPG